MASTPPSCAYSVTVGISFRGTTAFDLNLYLFKEQAHIFLIVDKYSLDAVWLLSLALVDCSRLSLYYVLLKGTYLPQVSLPPGPPLGSSIPPAIPLALVSLAFTTVLFCSLLECRRPGAAVHLH